MDRTVKSGTGFIGQYSPALGKQYESVDLCPDDLLLFMHHVPYTHRLHVGKTVIQYIYDSHYDGAAEVERFLQEWEGLKGRVDDERFNEVRAQLDYQVGQAIVWRDAVTRWFHRTSGIADAKNRVDNYPDRIEAESATLNGYVVKDVTPWETASGDKAVECSASVCTATFRFAGAAGPHDIVVRYFDVNTGAAKFRVRVGDRVLAAWTAADRIPTRRLDGSSSSRQVLRDVALVPGDLIVVEGDPDGSETAALDYIEIQAVRNRKQ
jgi:alpha-glucuronidase